MSRSKALASMVDPVTREYVNALIEEQIKPLMAEIASLKANIRSAESRISGWSGNLHARMNALEDAIKLTPATKRKMEALVEMLKGDE